MSNTLLLDTVKWDLVLDISGNIAMAKEPYALAQDAASAIKLFNGELWYNTSKGVPYWTTILGKSPPITLMKAKFEAAALTVPNVVSAKCFIASITHRAVTGQVQITSSSGQTAAASISNKKLQPPPPSGWPSLDFSDPANSQYLPGLA